MRYCYTEKSKETKCRETEVERASATVLEASVLFKLMVPQDPSS